MSKELLKNAQLRMQNAERTTKKEAFNYLGSKALFIEDRSNRLLMESTISEPPNRWVRLS
jgi:hypothetical protein